jgi:hypothetical protein
MNIALIVVIANLIEKEYVNCAPKLCHEYVSATQISSCLLAISISTTSDETTNKINKDNNNNSNSNKNNNNNENNSESSSVVVTDVNAVAPDATVNVSLSYVNNEVVRGLHEFNFFILFLLNH